MAKLFACKHFCKIMEDYEIIGWPEIQDFMDIEGFDDNATLIEENDAMGIDSSTYLVCKDWLDSLDENCNTKSKEVIDLYTKCQVANNMQPPRYAEVKMYWENEGASNTHSRVIALSSYDPNIDNDEEILFYANGIEELIELMEEDNGSDFVVTEVVDFY